MAETVSLPAFPAPLRTLNEPVHAKAVGDDALVLGAAGATDLFTDPDGSARYANAPALVGRIEGDFTLSARVHVDLAASYDAAVLLLHAGPDSWAKFCLELSPQGRPTVVSVVTRGVSDDCNSMTVDPGSDTVHMRVSRLGPAYAFHVRVGGGRWDLVRYFALTGEGGGAGEGAVAPEVGFLAQSPTGPGCTARFSEITYTPTRLADIRDGS
ncbi:DUF1349 domain-containing protein [Streptomonospora sp. S1-112]|uniref:DUF1349 domain-containing protein n=1 Tax=Streptomonospora mangrovi TaxID=2883123 RepID=A0A9X3SGE4_9ACTN|nr:DUF1349 domain-containing protein [Streptomonospora mangrovi]MDA0566802.1 DUF1349 domain-containing protein [Streptomonospora mangrovi]